MLRYHVFLIRLLLAFVWSPFLIVTAAACPGAQDADSGDGDGDGDGDAGSPLADGGDHFAGARGYGGGASTIPVQVMEVCSRMAVIPLSIAV